MSAFDPSDSLIFLTNRIGRQLANLVLGKAKSDGFKLQSTHMAILADLLQSDDGQRQQDLAVSAIKDKATIARGLAQMDQAGIVDRRVDPSDRRNKLIYLTEKGHAIKHDLRPVMESVMHAATRNVTQEELAACKRTLATIYHNLQENINPPHHD